MAAAAINSPALPPAVSATVMTTTSGRTTIRRPRQFIPTTLAKEYPLALFIRDRQSGCEDWSAAANVAVASCKAGPFSSTTSPSVVLRTWQAWIRKSFSAEAKPAAIEAASSPEKPKDSNLCCASSRSSCCWTSPYDLDPESSDGINSECAVVA